MFSNGCLTQLTQASDIVCVHVRFNTSFPWINYLTPKANIVRFLYYNSGGELHKVSAGVWLGFCVNCCGVTYSSEYRLCFWRKPHVTLVTCQFYHKMKAKQSQFDPLSPLDRPQPWNCCCFSNIWRQTSNLNLVVVGASAVCLIIRLFKPQWVCSKAGHKRRCLVLDFDLFYILQVATFIIPILFLHLSRLL